MAKTKSKAIAVRVSPTIAADYAKRRAFPALRTTGPYRAEGYVTYQVPPKIAAEILDDAKAQHGREFTREERGTKKSYRALIDMLDAQINPLAAVTATAKTQPGGQLTLAAITNRRVEASGLVVEDYSPRFKRYIGTAKQITFAGILPDSFPGFPKPDTEGRSWCSARWEDGPLMFDLAKKWVSAEACKLEDATADYWQFEIFDARFHFDDYLKRIAA